MQMITFSSKTIYENNGTILSTTYQRGDGRQGRRGHWWGEMNVTKYIITRKKVLKIISVIFIMWQWAWLIKAEGAALVDRTDILHKISSHK